MDHGAKEHPIRLTYFMGSVAVFQLLVCAMARTFSSQFVFFHLASAFAICIPCARAASADAGPFSLMPAGEELEQPVNVGIRYDQRFGDPGGPGQSLPAQFRDLQPGQLYAGVGQPDNLMLLQQQQQGLPVFKQPDQQQRQQDQQQQDQQQQEQEIRQPQEQQQFRPQVAQLTGSMPAQGPRNPGGSAAPGFAGDYGGYGGAAQLLSTGYSATELGLRSGQHSQQVMEQMPTLDGPGPDFAYSREERRMPGPAYDHAASVPASRAPFQRELMAHLQKPDSLVLLDRQTATATASPLESLVTMSGYFNPMLTFVSTLIWVVLVGFIGFVYWDHKAHPPTPKFEEAQIPAGRWAFGLFDCLGDPKLCFFTCCCSGIRWADNIRMANFAGFWQALVLYLVFATLPSLFLPLGCIWLFVVVYARSRLRQRYGLPSGCGEAVSDTLAYMFCAVCAITQEARQLELAWQVDPQAAANAEVGDRAFP